jgi:phospho-N-acetylmuramoyl-pentapeptide-transferase
VNGPTISIVQGILLAFALVVILTRPYLQILRRLGFGKRIREEGPGSHYVKEGTPTMGGLLLIAVIISLALLLGLVGPDTFAPLVTLGSVGALGTVDDYLNARTGEGIRIRQKILWQVAVAVPAAFLIQRTYAIDQIAVPFVGAVDINPVVYVAFAAFAIVGASNGVNITDGLDGLAAGTLIFAFAGFLIIALLNPVEVRGVIVNQQRLAILCALIIGALLGFLWFNVHPAQIFMGDSGALAFGATLAVTALITGQILILPLIGIIFVAEAGSVLLQVLSYKLTRRRIFRMSPIHHHFELVGWDEEKITMRFWIVAILAAMLGVVFFLASVERTA